MKNAMMKNGGDDRDALINALLGTKAMERRDKILAPFFRTHPAIINDILSLMKSYCYYNNDDSDSSKNGNVFMEFGCGDGEVTISVAKHFACHCVGIELEVDICRKARERVEEEKLSPLVDIVCGDMAVCDPSNAFCCYLYIGQAGNDKIVSNINDKLQKGSIVICLDYPLNLEIVSSNDMPTSKLTLIETKTGNTLTNNNTGYILYLYQKQ